jgi:hypothetical protein
MESEVNQVNIGSLSFLDTADVISEHRRRGERARDGSNENKKLYRQNQAEKRENSARERRQSITAFYSKCFTFGQYFPG